MVRSSASSHFGFYDITLLPLFFRKKKYLKYLAILKSEDGTKEIIIKEQLWLRMEKINTHYKTFQDAQALT